MLIGLDKRSWKYQGFATATIVCFYKDTCAGDLTRSLFFLKHDKQGAPNPRVKNTSNAKKTKTKGHSLKKVTLFRKILIRSVQCRDCLIYYRWNPRLTWDRHVSWILKDDSSQLTLNVKQSITPPSPINNDPRQRLQPLSLRRACNVLIKNASEAGLIHTALSVSLQIGSMLVFHI